MLSELYIENLAVIKKARINFYNGLNIFTGETGAGKSIVIDAINAILGQRTSRVIIRHGAQKATITACFQDISDNAIQKLQEFGFEIEDNQIIIEREISIDKSNARIMGRPVAISVLKEIGYELINIHGQHDSQILLAPEKHIEILDNFGGYTD
ncbi:MAG: AAA family ATPase, partial [Oscillospiraceae bacterium]